MRFRDVAALVFGLFLLLLLAELAGLIRGPIDNLENRITGWTTRLFSDPERGSALVGFVVVGAFVLAILIKFMREGGGGKH